MVATIDAVVATAWIERWDAQQEVYMPDREDRFTVLIDAVEEGAGRPDPLVIDLGCGPGSLSVRLLRRLPEAKVVAVDADPLLLGLGRAGAGESAPRFVEADLGQPGWSEALGLDRQVDAAVSTTALHWLAPERLAAMYAELATIIRPGGLLLNGDHLAEDEETAPVLAKLGGPSSSARKHGAGPVTGPRTGRPGGRRLPSTRPWPAWSPSAPARSWYRIITARRLAC